MFSGVINAWKEREGSQMVLSLPAHPFGWDLPHRLPWALLTASASASLQVHREESLPGACGSQAVRDRARHQTEQDEALTCWGWPWGILFPSVPQGWLGGCWPPTTTKHRNCSLPKTQPVCLNIQDFPFTVIIWGGYLSMDRRHLEG